MIKAGILGGGQLGRMLLQEAANYPVEVSVMEKDPNCPSAKLCHHFMLGDITNYDDVIRFGQGLDVITIEIENVNVDALFELREKRMPRHSKTSGPSHHQKQDSSEGILYATPDPYCILQDFTEQGRTEKQH